MTSSAEIETIVRRVLTGMLAGSSLSVSETTSAAVHSSSILRLHAKLITLASIPNDLAEIREVHVPTRAVVTPAVRDKLRHGKVTIVRTSLSASAQAVGPDKTTPGPTLLSSLQPLIVTGSANFMPAVMRTICPRQAKIMLPSQDDATSLREASAGIRNGHRAAVIIGSSAHAIAWQAGRDEKLRPVVVSQWAHLDETLAEVPTNLVILSTKYWNAPAASNLIRAFYKRVTQS